MKMSTEELLFSSQYFCKASTFSDELPFWKKQIFRKAILRITYFSWRAAFLDWLFFQKTLISIAATFSEQLFFLKKIIQKRYFFTATLLCGATLPIYHLAIKWSQYHVRTLEVWELFLVYLLLLKVGS